MLAAVQTRDAGAEILRPHSETLSSFPSEGRKRSFPDELAESERSAVGTVSEAFSTLKTSLAVGRSSAVGSRHWSISWLMLSGHSSGAWICLQDLTIQSLSCR